MTNYTAAVDAGNGGTNVAIVKAGNKKIKTHYEPSVRAEVSGSSLDLGSIEMDYEWTQWGNRLFVTGDDVLTVARRQKVDRHIGSQRYGDEFHQFLVANALARAGVKDGDSVNLILFAPPELYTEKKPLIIERFSEHGSKTMIMLKGDKKPRTITYESVNVIPEAIAAAFCFALDDNGQAVSTDALTGDVLVIDIGVYTIDCVILSNGELNTESYLTREREGLQRMRKELLSGLRARGGDYRALTEDDIDLLIRRALTEADYCLEIAGKGANLEKQFNEAAENYAGWIHNNLLDSEFDNLSGIRSLLLTGGGAAIVEPHIRRWLEEPGKLLDRTIYPTTKTVPSAFMNAVGGLRLALSRQKG